MEIQQVIRNIQSLCRKTVTNGCSEAEAMSAARKIGDLMKVYNLTMDKVFLGETKCITGRMETGRRRRHPVDGCVVAIAEFCDCRVWLSKLDKCYEIFGLEPDVEMAKYLYSIVWCAMETATAQYKQSAAYLAGKGTYSFPVSRKRLSVSFQKGMARRIYHRLQEMKDERRGEEDVESPILASSGTSLVVLKRNKVDEEFKQLSVRLTKAPRSKSSFDKQAFGAGKEAGDKVNLNRPLAGKVVGYLGGV